MSSGGRQILVNPLERATSTDIMRGQDFIAASQQELLRSYVNTALGSDDVNAGGLYTPNTSEGTPVAADIFAGLLFTPGLATTASVVTAGTVCLYDPDATPSADDSQYKLVEDAGTSLLTLTPNASGSIRVDIIECARVQPDAVIETDSRDVFNIISGVFAAATVVKVSQSQLQYRIRLGTPGGEFPGAVSGWLPLAVATVPSGTVTWDTVTVWDVRPLVTDRIVGIANISQNLPRRTSLMWTTNTQGSSLHQTSGVAEANFMGRRLGGQIQRGSPGTDTAYVDYADPANQDLNINLAGGGLVFFYLAVPFGLPRWARYTDPGFGSRQPRSPRGIPLVSQVPPSHVFGVATSQIYFPAIMGFTANSTAAAVCVGACTYASGVINLDVCADGWQVADFPPPPNDSSSLTSSGVFTLKENVDFPAGARKLRVVLASNITIDSSVGGYTPTVFPLTLKYRTTITGLDTVTGVTDYTTDKLFNSYLPAATSKTFTTTWVFEIELPNLYPSGTTPQTWDVSYTLATLPTGVTYNAVATMQVQAWKYGD